MLRIALGAVLIAFVMGSLHAYSVLIEAIEMRFGVTRATVSLVYSLATLSLISGVYATGWLIKKVNPALLAGVACVVCGGGLVLAASGQSLWTMFVGFGLIFGFANGIGYALSIERGGASFPAQKGLMMGLVTSAYCAGAIIFSKVFAIWATPGQFGSGMLVLAASLGVAAGAVVVLLRNGPASMGSPGNAKPRSLKQFQPQIVRLWAIYFFGVLSGMMALGHAAAVVSASGGSVSQMTMGAMIVSAGSATGSVFCGWLADRIEPRHVLTGCLGGVLVSMIVLIAVNLPVVAIGGLGLVGFAYGALITIIPVITASQFEADVSLAVFGRVFTAWGVAGLVGPWLGGLVYDLSGSYRMAFIVAGGAALIALFVSMRQRPAGYATP